MLTIPNAGTQHKITPDGIGVPALTHDKHICSGSHYPERKLCDFTGSSGGIGRPFPMIDSTVDQTNGSLVQVFSLRVAAAPLRELWISTGKFFFATAGEGAQ